MHVVPQLLRTRAFRAPSPAAASMTNMRCHTKLGCMTTNPTRESTPRCFRGLRSRTFRPDGSLLLAVRIACQLEADGLPRRSKHDNSFNMLQPAAASNAGIQAPVQETAASCQQPPQLEHQSRNCMDLSGHRRVHSLEMCQSSCILLMLQTVTKPQITV